MTLGAHVALFTPLAYPWGSATIQGNLRGRTTIVKFNKNILDRNKNPGGSYEPLNRTWVFETEKDTGKRSGWNCGEIGHYQAKP